MHRRSHSGKPVRPRLTIAAAITFSAIAPFGASAFTHQTLHSFCHSANCADGEQPNGLLQDAAGNLYGTTQLGGKFNHGIVFKLIPNADKSKYTEHILKNFCSKANCTDGSLPFGDLIMDVEGRLFGTTASGGHSDSGVIFEMTPVLNGWKFAILHSFCSGNCPDGSVPYSGLSYAGQASGAPWDDVSPLFGTTSAGGTGSGIGNGVAYELGDRNGWHYSVVHKFVSSSWPQPVLVDASGNIYGTTSYGGKYGGGLLYRLAANTWNEATLHNFCAEAGCTDGKQPIGNLLMDGAGNVFGATAIGGARNDGVVFERPAGGGYQVAYNFCSLTACADGEVPDAGLTMDGSGNLFGTTSAGGSDKGVVFELAPGGAETVLYAFCPGGEPCSDGAGPMTPVLLDAQGNLFGTTAYGGANGQYGTVFRLKP
jgi:uncharacterized repeat protein (TIGR03803 family)